MSENTKPRSTHGGEARGLAAAHNLPFGRFGVMFPGALPATALADAALEMLAQTMLQPDIGAPVTEAKPQDENPRIPAGYTYFGQFVDHDITFDPTPLGAQQDDPEAIVDFRSPALDLDSVYGRGPADQPYLYERDGLRLRLGKPMNTLQPPIGAVVGTTRDLLRLSAGPSVADDSDRPAILGDKRNDENKIVSQIHAAFVALHNRVVTDDALIDAFGADRHTPEARFAAASSIVRWHYQWVVVHDFLERICEPGMVTEVLNPGRQPRLPNYLTAAAPHPYMPVEFAGAAYRFGHSMVRPNYALNALVIAPPDKDNRVQRIPTFSRDRDPLANLNGSMELPDFWGIDWSFFLDNVPQRPGGVTVGDRPAVLPQPSFRIDALLADPLGDLPDFFGAPGTPRSILGNLAFRNLKRGQQLLLPSGQEVARRLGIAPLSDDILWGAGSRLASGATGKEAAELAATAARRATFRREWIDGNGGGMRGQAPLWYYILREAEHHGASEPSAPGAVFGGQHLGPVGSRIVAETLIGLLWLDRSSFLHSRRGFRPLPAIADGKPLTLGRLIGFALSGARQ